MSFHDQRSKKLVVVSHCILNQNARVFGLAQYPATVPEIVNLLQENKVGLFQLPCPELITCGVIRPRKTKEEYDTEEYRRVCKQIATTIADQLNEFLRNKVEVTAVIGIKNSPTCHVGSQPIEAGILMEELMLVMENRGVELRYHNLDFKKVSETIEWLKKTIR